jgi:hypothetical protein
MSQEGAQERPTFIDFKVWEHQHDGWGRSASFTDARGYLDFTDGIFATFNRKIKFGPDISDIRLSTVRFQETSRQMAGELEGAAMRLLPPGRNRCRAASTIVGQRRHIHRLWYRYGEMGQHLSPRIIQISRILDPVARAMRLHGNYWRQVPLWMRRSRRRKSPAIRLEIGVRMQC